MNKLKVRFMFVVCQFLVDWYTSQTVEDPYRCDRLKKLEDLMVDLRTEYEEE